MGAFAARARSIRMESAQRVMLPHKTIVPEERPMTFWREIRYWKAIKSVRLSVEAFVFKGSLAAFALF